MTPIRPGAAVSTATSVTGRGSDDQAAPSRFVGLAEIGADLGESPETVRKWIQNGSLGPVLKLPNGKWKMRREEYDRWLTGLIIDRRIA